MGNTSSEPSVLYKLLDPAWEDTPSTFAQQLEKAKSVHENRAAQEKQMKQDFKEELTTHFIKEIKKIIPSIILDKAKRGIHLHVHRFEITEEINRMYIEQRKLNNLDNKDPNIHHVMYGIYSAVHSDEFRKQLKEWKNELSKTVEITPPRRFKESVNVFTGDINLETRDHNFEVDVFELNKFRLSKKEQYEKQAQYFHAHLNYMMFSF